jgi:hypothetical protein
VVLTQLLPHAVVGAEHIAEQPDGPQNGAAEPHTVPHAPQFAGSELGFTQALPHLMKPVEHAQAPDTHD